MGRLLLAVTVCASGCHRSSVQNALTVQEYDASYNVLMHEYEKEIVYQTAKPVPAKPKDGPLGPWYQKAADGVLALSTATRSIVQRLDTMRPPPERLSVHRATRVLLDLVATDNEQWAATFRTGESSRIQQQGQSDFERESAAWKDYIAEAKRVGYVVPESLQHWPPVPQ